MLLRPSAGEENIRIRNFSFFIVLTQNIPFVYCSILHCLSIGFVKETNQTQSRLTSLNITDDQFWTRYCAMVDKQRDHRSFFLHYIYLTNTFIQTHEIGTEYLFLNTLGLVTKEETLTVCACQVLGQGMSSFPVIAPHWLKVCGLVKAGFILTPVLLIQHNQDNAAAYLRIITQWSSTACWLLLSDIWGLFS